MVSPSVTETTGTSPAWTEVVVGDGLTEVEGGAVVVVVVGRVVVVDEVDVEVEVDLDVEVVVELEVPGGEVVVEAVLPQETSSSTTADTTAILHGRCDASLHRFHGRPGGPASM